MFWHVILTDNCNLNCSYCCGGDAKRMPPDIMYNVSDLKKFIESDNFPVISFYGGEPLLKIPLMMEIMDSIKAKHFMLQTNGIYLDKVPDEYICRIHSILASIDGRQEITDGYRGMGVYKKVVENVSLLRKKGFGGDIIARMAVSEKSDIFEEVIHLYSLNIFDHIHWQLDLIWSPLDSWQNLSAWIEQYNKNISLLADWWLEKMKSGIVAGIVPFKSVMYSIISGTGSKLRCGSGIDAFAITTTGRILTCPISPEFKFADAGTIYEKKPDAIKGLMSVGEPCTSCDVYSLCGGRCLFTNKEKLWGHSGDEIACSTVKNMIFHLRRIAPEVEKLIDKEVIKLQDIRYPQINNGCEIIP